MRKYGIITKRVVHFEGDERSRTNPGHGYPAYSETIKTIETFESEELWLQYIKKNKTSKNPNDIIPIVYTEATVTVRTDVAVKY